MVLRKGRSQNGRISAEDWQDYEPFLALIDFMSRRISLFD
jgi:hypothetical protein